MLEQLTLESWQPYVGQAFAAHHVQLEQPQAWQLTEVSLISHMVDNSQRSAYRLYFTGPAQPYFAQGTHRLTHEHMGAVELFLVPLGPTAQGQMCYEAIFS